MRFTLIFEENDQDRLDIDVPDVIIEEIRSQYGAVSLEEIGQVIKQILMEEAIRENN